MGVKDTNSHRAVLSSLLEVSLPPPPRRCAVQGTREARGTVGRRHRGRSVETVLEDVSICFHREKGGNVIQRPRGLALGQPGDSQEEQLVAGGEKWEYVT